MGEGAEGVDCSFVSWSGILIFAFVDLIIC